MSVFAYRKPKMKKEPMVVCDECMIGVWKKDGYGVFCNAGCSVSCVRMRGGKGFADWFFDFLPYCKMMNARRDDDGCCLFKEISPYFLWL